MIVPRCAWSGERSDRLIEVSLPATDRFGRRTGTLTAHVLPEHEAELRAHADRVHRHGAPFLVAVIVLGLLAFVLAIAGSLGSVDPVAVPLSGVATAGIGLLFVLFPFTTPETSGFFGIRRSIVIARSLGAVLVAMGLAIAVLA